MTLFDLLRPLLLLSPMAFVRPLLRHFLALGLLYDVLPLGQGTAVL